VYAAKMSLNADALTDPTFRRALIQMVRRRVPESEAEDIVQSALAEALSAPNAPAETDGLRRFVWGIARHKVADYYRRARREALDEPEIVAEDAPHTEEDLLRWAARELPRAKDARQTLEWMLREGEGEKLEAIAESEQLPAPRVRQRVSRLRRHLKARWAVELAALAAIGVLVALLLWEVLKRPGVPITHEMPSAEPRMKDQVPPQEIEKLPKLRPGDTDVPNDLQIAPPAPSNKRVPGPPPSASPMPIRVTPPTSTAVPSKPRGKGGKSLTKASGDLEATPF
jgi:RNA polymerase sigma factor (sigma-70 family)